LRAGVQLSRGRRDLAEAQLAITKLFHGGQFTRGVRHNA
jgi:hypothetical protein